jgi:uncharacterized membrane protein HdeD (DUF308 family)
VNNLTEKERFKMSEAWLRGIEYFGVISVVVAIMLILLSQVSSETYAISVVSGVFFLAVGIACLLTWLIRRPRRGNRNSLFR